MKTPETDTSYASDYVPTGADDPYWETVDGNAPERLYFPARLQLLGVDAMQTSSPRKGFLGWLQQRSEFLRDQSLLNLNTDERGAPLGYPVKEPNLRVLLGYAADHDDGRNPNEVALQTKAHFYDVRLEKRSIQFNPNQMKKHGKPAWVTVLPSDNEGLQTFSEAIKSGNPLGFTLATQPFPFAVQMLSNHWHQEYAGDIQRSSGRDGLGRIETPVRALALPATWKAHLAHEQCDLNEALKIQMQRMDRVRAIIQLLAEHQAA